MVVQSRSSLAVNLRLRAKALLRTEQSAHDACTNGAKLQGFTLDELPDKYPMMCFCSPHSEVTPLCQGAQDGHRGRIPLWRMVLFAFPQFGWYAFEFMRIGYMKKFYIDDYPKANLGIISVSTVVSVLIDGVTDPPMASLSDNCKSRWGRRRPFVLVAAFYMPVVVLLAWTPALVPCGCAASIWFGIFHVLFKLGDTVYKIPHEAWGAQLTPLYQERTLVWQWVDIMANLGIVFGMAVLPLVFGTKSCTGTPEDSCITFPLMSALCVAIFTIASLALVRWGRESSENSGRDSPTRQDVPAKYSQEDIVPMLITAFLNKPFGVLLVAVVVKALGKDVPFHVLPFLTTWVVGQNCFEGGQLFGMLVIINIIAGLMSIPAWTLLSNQVGKYHAFVMYNLALIVTSSIFLSVRYDTDRCSQSYLLMVLSMFFGFAYGGSFLLNSLVSDIIDYDEFLLGGRRREAAFMMTVEFVPKFVSIPGESLPFIVLAFLKYARPPANGSLSGCASKMNPDEFCRAHFMAEKPGSDMCAEGRTCKDLLADGVDFVCNLALGDDGECGVKQNNSVRWFLILSFSVVPAFFMLCSLWLLRFYPKDARTQVGQEKLLNAITTLKEGYPAEDPWRAGNVVYPAPTPTPNMGVLSYLTPSELRTLCKNYLCANDVVDARSLCYRPLAWLIFNLAGVLPIGIVVTVLGAKDLTSDLGASVSPLGIMIAGVGLLSAIVCYLRFSAAREIHRLQVTCGEVVSYHNMVCVLNAEERLPVRDLKAQTDAVFEPPRVPDAHSDVDKSSG